MKSVTTLLLLCCLFFSLTLYSQTKKTKDKKQLTEREILKQEIDSLVNVTRDQFYLNNYDLAIEAGERTLAMARKIEDTVSIFAVSSLIGNAFLQIQDTTRAKKIFSETIIKAERLKDTSSIITAKIDLGNFYAVQEKSEPAITQYTETLPLAKLKADPVHLFILNYNIAELYLNLKDLEQAEYYVNETNSNINDSTNIVYKAVANLNNGKLYLLKKQPTIAKPYLEEAIKVSKEIGYNDPLIEGYEYYAKAEAELGNYASAYEYYRKVDELKAEKYKTDKIEAIESVTARFKLNQYEQELKAKTLQNEVNRQTTKRETTIFWVKIASAILLIFSIFLFISYRKRKKLVVDLIDKNKQYLEAKEKSEEYAKAKSILFSNITHELRTPMYGIIGISSVLMKDKKQKNFEENLSSLKFSANYLLSLINNVLQLTKIDSTKKDKLKRAKFNVRNLVENVVNSTKYVNQEHANEYFINIADDVPAQLIGDDVKLSQLLINIVGNSSKFTQNGKITIDITKQSSSEDSVSINFKISDTGIGISPEKQKYIFDEFTQTGISDDYRGAGLGLPIVKKILELHDSEIHLESEVGSGTIVKFSLTYIPVDEPDSDNEVSLEISPTILKGRTILVVDDNKINQIVTKKVLQMYGASIVVAGNGPDAIALAEQGGLDLILMDIHMPDMNGFEATERIRMFNSEIPIVALTAVELEKVTEQNASVLMNDFIIKPYKNEEFISTIMGHMKSPNP